jgi:hypothetical protein
MRWIVQRTEYHIGAGEFSHSPLLIFRGELAPNDGAYSQSKIYFGFGQYQGDCIPSDDVEICLRACPKEDRGGILSEFPLDQRCGYLLRHNGISVSLFTDDGSMNHFVDMFLSGIQPRSIQTWPAMDRGLVYEMGRTVWKDENVGAIPIKGYDFLYSRMLQE